MKDAAKFKNARIYKAILPPVAELNDALSLIDHRHIGELERTRTAIETAPEGGYVRVFPGGYALTFRVEEKLIPREVIDKTLAAALEAHTELTGTPPDRGTGAALKEEAYNKLLSAAFVKTKRITCYYWEASNLLIVPSPSQSACDRILGSLVQACGSIKTVTIHVGDLRKGLTTRMRSWLTDPESPAFIGFSVGDHLTIERKEADGGREREVYDRHMLDASESSILSSLRSGFEVTQVELYRLPMTFRLTDTFRIKGIDIEFITAPEIEQALDDGDAEEYWRLVAEYRIGVVADIVDALCDMVEYKAPDLASDSEPENDKSPAKDEAEK